MSYGIDDCHVELDPQEPEKIRCVEVRFGENYRIRLSQGGRGCELVLTTGHQAISLDAAGPLCTFERAMNLLRMHLPEAMA